MIVNGIGGRMVGFLENEVFEFDDIGCFEGLIIFV